LTERHQHPFGHNPNMKMGHYHGYSYVVLTKPDYEYTFAISHRRFAESKGLFLVLLVLIVIIVTTMSYFMVRRLFRPLRSLDEGVKQVGEGNFEFRVANKRQDEIGELVDAFNQMSNKIKSMMKEKEQLLLDVSHELRSPITRMKLALEFVEDEKSKSSIEEDLLEMESMIAELLESARLKNPGSNLSKENIQLNDLISNVTSAYTNSKPGVIFIAPESKITLLADRKRFQICLRNIIENALKYSKEQSEAVVIEAQEQQDNIQIIITDYGVGIPQSDQQHVFEPFYRVDKSRNSKTGGYGLGLNLCKNIVKAHGGEIYLNSIENEKTSFTLVFPKLKGKAL
jgi:signal transduction histidine kinase